MSRRLEDMGLRVVSEGFTGSADGAYVLRIDVSGATRAIDSVTAAAKSLADAIDAAPVGLREHMRASLREALE